MTSTLSGLSVSISNPWEGLWQFGGEEARKEPRPLRTSPARPLGFPRLPPRDEGGGGSGEDWSRFGVGAIVGSDGNEFVIARNIEA